jgi:rare lipoprotein A
MLAKRLWIATIVLSFVYTASALAGTHYKRHAGPHRADAVEVGIASWYGYGPWHPGRRTANGERFDPQAMTCAHRTLPLGSVVKVTDIATGKDVVLEVTDRGPYGAGRIVDLSEGAARELGIRKQGVTVVRLEVVSQPDPAVSAKRT